jgi:hypothetical protein
MFPIPKNYMRRLLLWISITGNIIGIVCFYSYNTFGSGINSVPVSLSFPDVGATVSSPFTIENGGKFNIDIIMQMSSEQNIVSTPDPPAIICSLDVLITNKKEFKFQQHITSLEYSGLIGSMRKNIFSGPNRKRRNERTTGKVCKILRFFIPTLGKIARSAGINALMRNWNAAKCN